VRYNLKFEAYPDALHACRYPDLTRHVSFIAGPQSACPTSLQLTAPSRHSGAPSRLEIN